MFNPRTGQLFLKIIHTSVWAGQKRLGQVSIYCHVILMTSLLYRDLDDIMVISCDLDDIMVVSCDLDDIIVVGQVEDS